MRRGLGLSLVVLALSFFLAVAQGAEEKGMTVTEKANGTTVKVARGSTLTIQLKGNPTTGFGWSIDQNNKEELSPVGKPSYAPDRVQPGIVGSGGKFVFKFKAAKAGTSELKLVYQRAWEKDKPPAKTFTVKVEIE